MAIAISRPITMLKTLTKWVSCLLTRLSARPADSGAQYSCSASGFVNPRAAVRAEAGSCARDSRSGARPAGHDAQDGCRMAGLAPVAQLDRVAASEAAGRWFESSRARHCTRVHCAD